MVNTGGLALLWSSMMVSTAFLLLFLWWVHSYRHAYHHGSFLVCRASVKSCTISFASQFNCFLQTLYSTIHPCKTPVKYRFVHLRPSLHQDLVPCNLLHTSPCYLQIRQNLIRCTQQISVNLPFILNQESKAMPCHCH